MAKLDRIAGVYCKRAKTIHGARDYGSLVPSDTPRSESLAEGARGFKYQSERHKYLRLISNIYDDCWLMVFGAPNPSDLADGKILIDMLRGETRVNSGSWRLQHTESLINATR